MFFTKWGGGRGLHCSGSGQGQVERFRASGSELPGSIRCTVFLEYLRSSYFIKNNFPPWNKFRQVEMLFEIVSSPASIRPHRCCP